MVFWILSVVSAVFIGWWIYNIWADTFFFETWVGRSLVTFLAGAIVLPLLIVLIGVISAGLSMWLSDYEKGDTEKVELVALQTKDSEEGRFGGTIFASYGYMEGERVISYISRAEDGGVTVGFEDADDSTIYEGEEDPHMITQYWTKENRWFWPFGSVATGESYEFHIPTGTIVDGYEVSP